MEKIQEIENKISTYKNALQEVTAQLTQKRSELGALAHVTIEHLQTEIPALRKQSEELKEEIKQLDSLVKIRNFEYSSKKEDLEAHYKNLEDLLKTEYISRKKELDTIEQKFSSREMLNLQTENSFSDREKNITEREEILFAAKEVHQKDVETSRLNNAQSLQELELRNSKIAELNKQLDDRVKSIETFKSEVDFRSVEVAKREKACEDILLRINEANVILENAKNIEEDYKKRESSLNEMHVKNIAETNRITKRGDVLNEKESLLKAREDNVKLAEEAIAKG